MRWMTSTRGMTSMRWITSTRSLRAALAAAVLWSTAACTTFVDPVVTARSGESTAFEGLAQLAAGDEATAIDLLLVHGMCTHDEGWADAAIGQVATMLGADAAPVVDRLAVSHSSADVFGADVATPAWQARIAAIVWSPIVASTKAELCQDTTSKAPACRRDAERLAPQWFSQASAAGPIRDSLVDDCMADAVIYLGRARDQINDQMQKALVTAARHFEARRGNDTGVTRPLVVITQSLGAKLAFDALLRMQQDYSLSHVGDRLAERTTRIYLAANQLPFLQLGDATVADDGADSEAAGPAQRRHLMRLLESAEAASPSAGVTKRAALRPTATQSRGIAQAGASAQASASARTGLSTRIAGMPEPFYAPDPVDQFIRLQAAHRPAAAVTVQGRSLPALQVVAFNDPHDVMAYAANPSRRTGSDIIDVTLELEPAALGIVVAPDPAHLNYLRDARVRQLILCGHGQPACPVARRAAQQTALPAVHPAAPPVASQLAPPAAPPAADPAPPINVPPDPADGAAADAQNAADRADRGLADDRPTTASDARPLPAPIRPPQGVIGTR